LEQLYFLTFHFFESKKLSGKKDINADNCNDTTSPINPAKKAITKTFIVSKSKPKKGKQMNAAIENAHVVNDITINNSKVFFI
jgi:hypothetical protein